MSAISFTDQTFDKNIQVFLYPSNEVLDRRVAKKVVLSEGVL